MNTNVQIMLRNPRDSNPIAPSSRSLQGMRGSLISKDLSSEDDVVPVLEVWGFLGVSTPLTCYTLYST